MNTSDNKLLISLLFKQLIDKKKNYFDYWNYLNYNDLVLLII